jgi:hypothetical protein
MPLFFPPSRHTRNAHGTLLAVSLLVFVLVFTWSITGTIALRQVLLVLLIGAAAYVGIDTARLRQCGSGVGVLLLLALSGWIVLHNLFLAWDPARSWGESTQWWRAMLCLALGIALGCPPHNAATPNTPASPGTPPRWTSVASALAAAWALHLLLNVALADWRSQPFVAAMQTGTPIGTRDMVSYLGTGLLALLLADGVGRAGGQARLFALADKALWAGVFAATGLTAATMTRNSIVVMALEWAIAMIALNSLSASRRQRVRHATLALAALLLVGGAATANFVLDARWQNFADSARIAWDIEHNDWWIDQVEHAQPITPRGIPVDHSAYSRIAWARGASHMIAEYPLGTGYDRNAFRRTLMRHYGAANTAAGHAHAGLLDFTLATGVPGGLLFVAALLALMAHGWRNWRRRRDAAGLALLIFVASYLARAAIDGIVRDHMLEQAMFVCGLLLAATTPTQPGRWPEETAA